MKIGYARVSTPEQSMENQISNLRKAGCEKIYTDQISGTKSKKPGFEMLMAILREGDIVTVTSLDRLGRSSSLLLKLLEEWQSKNIHIHILTLDLDTSTAAGKLIYSVMAALAESERNLISERTKKGLEGARARGRMGGRPKKMTEKRFFRMKEIYDAKQLSIKEICLMYGIGRSTLYHYLYEYGGQEKNPNMTKKKRAKKMYEYTKENI